MLDKLPLPEDYMDEHERAPTPIEELIPPSPEEYAYAEAWFKLNEKSGNFSDSGDKIQKISRFKEEAAVPGNFDTDAALGLEKNFALKHSFIKIGNKIFALAAHDTVGEGGWGQVKHCWDEWGNVLAFKAEGLSSSSTLGDYSESDEAAAAANQLIASGYRLSDAKAKAEAKVAKAELKLAEVRAEVAKAASEVSKARAVVRMASPEDAEIANENWVLLKDRLAVLRDKAGEAEAKVAKAKDAFFGRDKFLQIKGQVVKKVTIMPEAKGIELFDYLKKNQPMDSAHFLIIFHGVMQALADLHAKGVLHLDVKPENFRINPDDLSIIPIDFGFSVVLKPGEEGRQMNTICGSYQAREVMEGYYSPTTDVYAAAVSLFGGLGYTYLSDESSSDESTDSGDYYTSEAVQGYCDEMKFSDEFKRLIVQMKERMFSERPEAREGAVATLKELELHKSDPRVQKFLSDLKKDKRKTEYADLIKGPKIASLHKNTSSRSSSRSSENSSSGITHFFKSLFHSKKHSDSEERSGLLLSSYNGSRSSLSSSSDSARTLDLSGGESESDLNESETDDSSLINKTKK